MLIVLSFKYLFLLLTTLEYLEAAEAAYDQHAEPTSQNTAPQEKAVSATAWDSVNDIDGDNDDDDEFDMDDDGLG